MKAPRWPWRACCDPTPERCGNGRVAQIVGGWLQWSFGSQERSVGTPSPTEPFVDANILGFQMLMLALITSCLMSSCSVAQEKDVSRARQRMVTEQLARRDITNQLVLHAMSTVPRHEFVPYSLRDQAYNDNPLPIGYSQTISQPYIVAFMTQALNPRTNEIVMEVGTGSGYQAAVLATLVKEVYTIEIVTPLAERAEADLRRLAFTNVHVRAGDGYEGWAAAAPFDAIIVTCAPEKVPQLLLDQLKHGGRMIIPVGPAHDQSLYLFIKEGGTVRQQSILPVRFVPMTGKVRVSGP